MTTRADGFGGTEAAAPDPAAVRRLRPSGNRSLHASALIIIVLGLAVTIVLAVGAEVSISTSVSRALAPELRQAAAGLQSSVPSMQDPLVAADGIASSVGTRSFRLFADSLVGARAPFRSVSLWSDERGVPRLLARVGSTPELPASAGGFTRFFRSVRPSSTLAVAGLLSPRARGIGVAIRERGVASKYIVYAVSRLPQDPRVRFAANSPFSGLDFAIYLGMTPSHAELIEASVPMRSMALSGRMVVMFGDVDVTIVAFLESRPTGVLPGWFPWVIGAVGLALTASAMGTTERLLRRRELAELAVTDQQDRYTTQRGIAQTLQRSLRGSEEPTHAGVEIAARYVAGVEQLDVGGDWYDVIDIDEDHIFVTVGDVSGRGLEAATIMGSLRPAVRAYAIQGDAPATVLRKLDGLVDVQDDGCYATVLCAVIDLAHHRVMVASAGHPPALLAAEGGARFLTTPVSAPVGVAGGSPATSSTYPFPASSTLVLYTDGLIERRGCQLDDRLELLRASVESSVGSVEDVLDTILARMVEGPAADDVALLALRPIPLPQGRSWRDLPGDSALTTQRFACEPSSVQRARDFVTEVLASDGTRTITDDERDVVVLLVSELATNAVRHAHTPFVVRVVVSKGDGRVRVGVTDSGRGAPVSRAANGSSLRGRGLQLVDTLSRAWGVEWSKDDRSKSVWFESPGQTNDASVTTGSVAGSDIAPRSSLRTEDRVVSVQVHGPQSPGSR